MIVIPTWCNDLEALYGSTLTFKTVRVGFADEVLVIDNGSIPEAQAAIRAAAEAIGARFIAEPVAVPHWALLRQILTTFDCPLVICDPDLMFWERMSFPDALWAGRLIPGFYDEYTGCLTLPRLHTGLWRVPRPKVLMRVIEALEQRYWEANMLRPVMLPRWVRYDTGAVLYAEIGGLAFTESQLDCYDHLFAGSHLKHVYPAFAAEDGRLMVEWHAKAKSGDIESLRGIWRQQEQYFVDRSELYGKKRQQ